MTNINGQQHTGYRSIEETPFADAERVASGEAITFGGNGAGGSWRSSGQGTLGFFGADLGSSAPTEGRVPAFLGLAERTGGVYVENPPTVGDALRQTGLDFEVRHAPLTATRMEHVLGVNAAGEPEMVEQATADHLDVPGFAATVAYPRDGGQPFAIAPTSKRYAIVQNEEALSVGDAISEGRLVALGAYGQPVGAKVYAAYELGEGMSIGGGDPYRNFLTITTSHDRSGGLTALLAPIRLGCTNQTFATFRGKAVPRYVLRHTGNPQAKVDEARRILGLAHTYLDTLVTEAEQLLAAPMGKDRFVVYAKEVFGVPDDAKQTKQALRLSTARSEQLLEILASQTCEFGRGTAYAGYQAVTEYLDHFGAARGDEQAKTARRQERILIGKLDAAKDRAWDLATV